MSLSTHQLPYQRQPLKRTIRAFWNGLLWIDRMALRPGVKPFVLAFIGMTIVLTGGAYVASPWFELILNKSDSLPGTLYFLDKTKTPECGETTVFQMPVSERFYRGYRMIKIIKGCPGDVITEFNREIFINRRSVGQAMIKTSDGQYDLFPLAQGAIPEHKVYLKATHPKSFDSRYASFGLRDRAELLGTAVRLF